MGLKVYNKEGKLNIIIRKSDAFNVVIIYKYNGENIDAHSYVIPGKVESRPWQVYYELKVEEIGELKESLLVSGLQTEYREYLDETKTIETIVNLESKNRYENRIKFFEGEKYEVEFKNNKLHDFKFSFQESKINEFLKILHDEK